MADRKLQFRRTTLMLQMVLVRKKHESRTSDRVRGAIPAHLEQNIGMKHDNPEKGAISMFVYPSLSVLVGLSKSIPTDEANRIAPHTQFTFNHNTDIHTDIASFAAAANSLSVTV